jgi:hypothetical protein
VPVPLELSVSDLWVLGAIPLVTKGGQSHKSFLDDDYRMQRVADLARSVSFLSVWYIKEYVVRCFPGVTTHRVVSFTAQLRALVSSFSRFLDHTQRLATVGRTPLDE